MSSSNPAAIDQSNELLESTKIITDFLGISLDPTQPLHVARDKNVRFEMGAKATFSLGAPGVISFDKENVPGGRFIIQNNGNVGINQADPKTTLDVNGTIKATSLNFTSELSVPGMKPDSKAPDPARLRVVFIDPTTGTLYYHG